MPRWWPSTSTLVALARQRLPESPGPGSIDFCSGDMLDPALGHFDHVAAMDSVIHYRTEDAWPALARLGQRTSASILFTFAPRTPMLATMIAVGRLFPRGDRAPWIQPMAEDKLWRLLSAEPSLQAWQRGRTERISSGSNNLRGDGVEAAVKISLPPALHQEWQRLLPRLMPFADAVSPGTCCCRGCCACRCSSSRSAWPPRCWSARSTA